MLAPAKLVTTRRNARTLRTSASESKGIIELMAALSKAYAQKCEGLSADSVL